MGWKVREERTQVYVPEKVCAAKGNYKPDSVTAALSGGSGLNFSKLMLEACERKPNLFECNRLLLRAVILVKN